MKWYGNIGFADQVEKEPGYWVESITEHSYYGDVLRNFRTINSSDKVNEDVNINNEISIVCDPYAMMNFHKIRYIEFMNNKWKVSSVEPQFPRLILSIGGLYNG